ncbi:MAG: hypothetical protein Q8L84_11070 [Hyphomonas sp.]|nr:hypothetical protein [Hyphomonas sp.]
MKWFVFRFVAFSAMLALAASCTSVPEKEGARVSGIKKDVDAASGNFSQEQAAIAASASALESSAAACLNFTSGSALLQSQCYRISAVAYDMLGRLADENGVAAEKASQGMKAVSAAAKSSVCSGAPGDTAIAENCDLIELYSHALTTRVATAQLAAMARSPEPSAGDLVNALNAFEDGAGSDWPLMSAKPGQAETVTVLKTGMLCRVTRIRSDLPASFREGDAWPPVADAYTTAVSAGAADLKLPLCSAGADDCTDYCEAEPKSSDCTRQRMAAALLLCGPGPGG